MSHVVKQTRPWILFFGIIGIISGIVQIVFIFMYPDIQLPFKYYPTLFILTSIIFIFAFTIDMYEKLLEQALPYITDQELRYTIEKLLKKY